MNPVLEYAKLGRKYLVTGEPMALIYFVTKTCNCTCAHCFYWESLNKPRPNELTLAELDSITTSLGKLLYLRFSGGEPFIRKDLFEIVQLFTRKCAPSYIGIPTNGFYTDKIISFAEKLDQVKTRIEIGISIDDLGPYHNKIRGPENLFAKAMETFARLKNTQKKIKNLKIGFITTAMKSNQERLGEIFDSLSALGPDSISCNVIRDDTLVKEEKEINHALADRFSQLCDQYNARGGAHKRTFFQKARHAKTLYAHRLRKKVIETNEYQIPCVAGNKIVVMYAEGEIHPCETLGYEIGNIRNFDYDMKKILQSERAKEIRKKIISENCFCTHECFTTASIVFSKKQLLHILPAVVTPAKAGVQ